MSKWLSHKLERRLKELGLSARAASLKAGLGPDAIRNILRGKSANPKGRTLERLAQALDLPVTELLSPADSAAEETPQRAIGVKPWSDLVSNGRHANTESGSIPVFATYEAGGYLVLVRGQAIERTAPSEPVAGVGSAYAVYAPNDLLEPRCERGDLLHIHPHRPARPGKLVLVLLNQESEGGQCALLRELVSVNGQEVTLRQLNPEDTVKVPRSQIADIHLVVGIIST